MQMQIAKQPSARKTLVQTGGSELIHQELEKGGSTSTNNLITDKKVSAFFHK